jgi:hypothetical protein
MASGITSAIGGGAAGSTVAVFGLGGRLPGTRCGGRCLKKIEGLSTDLFSLPAEDGFYGRITEADGPFQIDE